MQGMRLARVSFSGLALFLITSSVFASCMSVPDGWYLEANVGSSHISNLSLPGSSSSSGIGGNANFGYKFMPYFATEIGYSQYQNTTIKNALGNKAATVQIYSYDIAAKGIVPIVASGFELFAKLGAQRLSSKTTISNTIAAFTLGVSNTRHSSTGLYYGIGGEYYFLPELAVVVQWQRAQGSSSTGTLDLYSIGLSFIFD